jgi:type IV pilus assembly protein PilX
MNNSIRASHIRRGQGGMTVVVVLVLLSVMLMGGLALGRLGEVGTLVAGNVASKEASMQASQIGTMNAFKSIQQAGFDEGLDSQDAARGTKYFAMMQATDAFGMPQVAWEGVPEVVVGRYSVRAVIDRMCNKLIITDALQDCLVREVRLEVEKANANTDPVESPNARQFRVTVRVTDARGTQTFTQAMVSRF